MAVNQLTEYLRERKCQGFTRHPYYSKEGDFLTYYLRDVDFFAERLDDVLTVYLAMSDDGGWDFVGFKLKGVRRLLEALGLLSECSET
jgi:hypothetical protein